jgi:hypothetical protein
MTAHYTRRLVLAAIVITLTFALLGVVPAGAQGNTDEHGQARTNTDAVVAGAQGLTPEQETALRGIAKGEAPEWPAMTPEQAKALFEKSEQQLTDHQAYCLPHGLSVDVFWTDHTRTKPLRYETIGDSACWAGHYLAAIALRYKVTQDPKALQDVKNVLEKFDLLTRVSGRVGYIARYAGAADNEAYREYYKVYGRGEDPERPGLGKCAYQGVEPYTDLVWLGNSSRDTYDGTSFGLATAWAYVDDAAVRQQIKTIVETVGKRLVEDEYFVIDGKGHKTNPTPSFKLSWMRLMASVSPDVFGDVKKEYYTIIPDAIARGGRVYPVTYKEYFANNLNFIRMYTLAILEDDSATKAGLQEVLRKSYHELEDTLNPHFAAIYLDATGDTDAKAIAVLQGQLIDLPGPPRYFKKVDYRNTPGYEMREDNPELMKYALLSRERPASDFIWQRSPVLSHRDEDVPYETPGIDLFLPYWMGRECGHIPAP